VATNRVLIGAALAGSLVGASFALTGVASAATTTQSVTVSATDDSYVSSTRRTTNFGAADKLVVGRADGETRVSLLKFTVGALGAGATLKGAELRLPVEGSPVASTLSLLKVPSNSWSQRTVTAATAPATGATVSSVRPAAKDTVLRFDVSKVITRPGTYSFALKSAATAEVTRLRAVEHGDGPELKITIARSAVPAPVTKAPTIPTTTPTTVPTTAPTTVPTSAPTTSAPAGCVTGKLLVPSCGVLWGASAGSFTDIPKDVAVRQFEADTGRTAAIFHAYHRGDEKFPTASEIAMSRDPAKPRVLLLNWKVAYGSTWAKVAAGEKDARIIAFADHVRKNYPEKFFLALHHEPENDVVATAGSGMTAKDYAAMYRHVVTLLRAKGITNVINVLAYMGNEKWMAQSWWKDIYPGDAYVDWIGLDSYVSVEQGAYHFGDFAGLLDRAPKGGGVGFYDWASTQHADKPIMVSEWGMYHRTGVTVDKAAAFQTVLPQLKRRPNIKAIVYFECAADDEGDRNISMSTTPTGLAAFRALAADPIFDVTITR
jgi:hypothetical protein